MQNFQEQEWNLLAEMVHCKIEKGNQNKVTKLTILTFQYSSDNFTIHNICNRSRWLTLNYWYIFLSAVAYDWQCCNIISRVNWLLNSRDYYYRPNLLHYLKVGSHLVLRGHVHQYEAFLAVLWTFEFLLHFDQLFSSTLC